MTVTSDLLSLLCKKYKVVSKCDGHVRLETNHLEEAKLQAARDAVWNQPDDVIDHETNEVIHTAPAYRDRFFSDDPPTLGITIKDGTLVPVFESILSVVFPHVKAAMTALGEKYGWPKIVGLDGAFEPPKDGWHYEVAFGERVVRAEGKYVPGGVMLRWWQDTNKKW